MIKTKRGRRVSESTMKKESARFNKVLKGTKKMEKRWASLYKDGGVMDIFSSRTNAVKFTKGWTFKTKIVPCEITYYINKK